jgi:hypothetical protein
VIDVIKAISSRFYASFSEIFMKQLGVCSSVFGRGGSIPNSASCASTLASWCCRKASIAAMRSASGFHHVGDVVPDLAAITFYRTLSTCLCRASSFWIVRASVMPAIGASSSTFAPMRRSVSQTRCCSGGSGTC